MKLRNAQNAVEKWKWVICFMRLIGNMEEAVLGLGGMEEPLHTNARIVATWSSMLNSREQMQIPALVGWIKIYSNKNLFLPFSTNLKKEEPQ